MQDSYTHVKTQIGVLCRTGTRKMKCLIWFKVGTGQQCNRVVEIPQISLDSVIFLFFFSVTVQKRCGSKTPKSILSSWCLCHGLVRPEQFLEHD